MAPAIREEAGMSGTAGQLDMPYRGQGLIHQFSIDFVACGLRANLRLALRGKFSRNPHPSRGKGLDIFPTIAPENVHC